MPGIEGQVERVEQSQCIRTVTQALKEMFELGMERNGKVVDVGRALARVAIENALAGNLDWFKLVVDRVDGAQSTKLDLTVLTPEQTEKARQLASVYDSVDALPAPTAEAAAVLNGTGDTGSD